VAINRIDEFITLLRPLTDEVAIKELCEAELTYLRNSLNIKTIYDANGIAQSVEGSVTSLHSQLTDYRNAVKSLELTASNSYRSEAGRSGNRRIEVKHLALKYLVKNDIEKLIRGEIKTTAIYQKHVKTREVNADDVISKAEELLDSKYYTSVALGLMLLTGRRATEILKTAIMEVVDDDNVLFSGQLKTKDSINAKTKPYTIPVLTNSEKIVDALSKLRAMNDFSNISNDAVHSKTNSTLNDACKRSFKGLIDNPMPKDLRAVYAAICVEEVSHRGQSDDAFIAQILGHAEEDIVTAQSYKGFEVI
jgi:integrase